MRFENQQFFYYEQELWHGYSLNGLLRPHSPEAGLLPTTGLADLRENLLITDEWYHNFPLLSVKELATTCADVDSLDFEPETGKLEFGREICLHAVVREEEPKHNLKSTGVGVDQNISVAVGLLQLYKADYWPKSGDRIFWKGRLYDMITVYSQPEDYYKLSGVPLHLTLNAEITQHEHVFIPYQALGSEALHPEPAWFVEQNVPNENAPVALPEPGGLHIPHQGSPDLLKVNETDVVFTVNANGYLVEEEETPTEGSGELGGYSGSVTLDPDASENLEFTLPAGLWFWKAHTIGMATDDRSHAVEIKGLCQLSATEALASAGESVDVVGTSSSLELPTVILSFNELMATIAITNNSDVAVTYAFSMVLFGDPE